MARRNVRSTSNFPARKGWKSSRGVMLRDARARVPFRAPAKEGELKFTTNSVTQDATTTSTFILLNGTTRGADADSNRIGRNIQCKSLQWHITATSEAGCTQPAGPLRFLLVWDKDPNGTLPAVTDLLETASVPAMINMANKDRFIVLHDSIKTTPSGNSTGLVGVLSAQENCILFNGYRKLNMKTVYNAGNAGTIADIQHGALYSLVLSDIAAGTGDWNTDGRIRLRYTDA